MLKGELSGDFERVILGLMMLPADYDAVSINEALKGTDKRALVEVMCSRTNQQMQDLSEAYQKCKR